MARTRTFCCCLPVRFGVFILTILNLFGGVLIAIVGWMQVSQLRKTPLSTTDEIALILHSATFSVLAAISLLGFIGAIIKNRGLVSSFSVVLLIFLCISVATGVYAMISLFRNNAQALVQACLDGSQAADQDVCKTTAKVTEAIIIAIYVVVWLLQLWGYVIVINYCHQLEDEEEELLRSKIVEPASMSGKPTTTYDSFGLGAPPSGLRTGISIPSPDLRRVNRSEV
ncbi:hypothetical protein AX14_012839 [Amanita brunnescens Koide BX004]|nr:hypothetical protein AX14_012839 [Amanita brunnescens Koide BX004]